MPLTFPSETEQPTFKCYLKKTTNVFKDWKESGLTDQAFLACIQAMSAVSELELDQYIGQPIYIGRYQGQADILYRLSTTDKILA